MVNFLSKSAVVTFAIDATRVHDNMQQRSASSLHIS